MRILIQGSFDSEGSLGRVNQELTRALLATAPPGSTVAADPWEGVPPVDLPRRDSGWGEPDVTIRQIWPPVWERPAHGRLVMLQPWEFGTFPASWTGPAQKVDALWAPSTACKAGWMQSGIHPDRVWLVPYGIGQTARHASLPASRPVRFLFLGGPIYRKGLDILVEAFDLAFGEEPAAPVELVIKATGQNSFYAGQNLLPELKRKYPRIWSRIRVIEHFLSDEERDALIRRSHALVHPYRGEGFGLPVLEAMAEGTLVITSAQGATRDFATEDCALLIPGRYRFFTQANGEWLAASGYLFEPDAAQLAGLLSQVARDPGHFRPLQEAALGMARRFLWPEIGRQAWAALQGLLAGGRPRDGLSDADRAVRQALAGGQTGEVVDAVSRLIAIGDPRSAAMLLDGYRARNASWPLALAELADSTREAAERETDRWPRSPHRLALYAWKSPPALARPVRGQQVALRRTLTQFLSGATHVRLITDNPARLGPILTTGLPEVTVVGLPEQEETFSTASPPDAVVINLPLGPVPEQLPALIRQAAAAARVLVTLEVPECPQETVWRAGEGPRDWDRWQEALDQAGVALFPGITHLAIWNGRVLAALAVGQRVPPPAPLPKPDRPRVVWLGLFQTASGLGREARELSHAALPPGWTLERVDTGAASSGTGKAPLDLSDPWTVPFRRPDVSVSNLPFSVLDAWSEDWWGAFRIARTMYEVDPVPPALTVLLKEFDRIWVPSAFVRDLFQEAGLDPDRLILIPDGVSLPDGLRPPRPPGQPVTLLSVFHWEDRKDPETLLRGFLAAFPGRGDVKLILHSAGVSPAAYARWLRAHGLEAALRDPRIVLLDRVLSPAEQTLLYYQADLFVLPTRGEGFGLPFLEAMAHGVAVVAPDHGGHRDFAEPDNAFLVPSRLVPVPCNCDMAAFRGSRWYQVDFEAWVETLRYAVDQEAERKKRAAAGRETAGAWSWNAARRVLEAEWRSIGLMVPAADGRR